MRVILTILFCLISFNAYAGQWKVLILAAVSEEKKSVTPFQPVEPRPTTLILPAGPLGAPIPDEIRHLFEVEIPIAEDCPDGNCPVKDIGEAKRLPPPQTQIKRRQPIFGRRLRR
jgi:hypothetical protein